MRPKKPETTGSTDLFRARLDQIINLKHELAQLAGKIDWDWIDGEIAPLYSDKGRPGIETRFAIGLLLLKHIYRLSDEGACDRWVHDPYFQYAPAVHADGDLVFDQHASERRAGELAALIRVEDRRLAMAGRASSSASTQNAASIVIDTRHDSTRRLNQSSTTAR